MKKKFFPALSRYALMCIAFLPMLPVLRATEYITLLKTQTPQALKLESLGMLNDLVSFSVFALVLFIPYFLIFLLRSRTAQGLFISALCLLVLIQEGLIRYFSINLMPLDDVLFKYSFREVIMIIRNSDGFDIRTLLPLVIGLALVPVFQFLFRNIRMPRPMVITISLFILISPAIAKFAPTKISAFDTDFLYYIRVNKSAFFFKSTFRYAFHSIAGDRLRGIERQVNRYHEIHDEFRYTSQRYPLLHTEVTPNTLGPFFNLTSKPPNLVFIIVESLSSACIGNDSHYGDFTPFLDSLIDQSLYWNNFLSTSERTFFVLQGLMGSLPYGSGEFQGDMAQMPYHQSLIRILKENGYYTSFFYGGDWTFTNYDQFLKKQGIDFHLSYFGPGYGKDQLYKDNYRWGYQDAELFSRSLEVVDSLNKRPRLDIYLTLSMHNPFRPPNASYYLRKYEKIVSAPGFTEDQKRRSAAFKELFSTVLYTDDALRDFFARYSRRADFGNTIFFITGDHFFQELGYTNVSAIERYHVPLIIYSPLLKAPRRMNSVSSHLDVTPSVLALLRAEYPLKEQTLSHWLGSGIDTAKQFRMTRVMAFETANRIQVDYLDKNLYLTNGRLYRITGGLKSVPVKNSDARHWMEQDLKTTMAVYSFVNENNLLIPSQLILPIQSVKIPLLSGTGLFRTHMSRQNGYLNMIKPQEIPDEFLQLQFKARIKYKVTSFSDTGTVPRMVTAVDAAARYPLLYHTFKFPGAGTAPINPGTWYTFELNETIDVSTIDTLKGKFLKFYFYNSRKCDIWFDSLEYNISGIK